MVNLMTMSKKSLFAVTDRGIERIKAILEKKGSPEVCGIRIGVKRGGCSGLSYYIEYISEPKAGDEIVYDDDKIKVAVEPAAVFYLAGTEMDFEDNKFSSRFVFRNPNEKKSCGCGKSFTA